MPNSRRIVDLLPRGDVHPGIVKLFIETNDELHALRQNMAALAALFDQMTGLQQVQLNALGGIQSRQNEMLRRAGVEVAGDPSVTGESDVDPVSFRG